MFAFKKLITPFILPPGIFILILIISGLLFLRRSRRAGVLCIATAAALWLLSITPVSDLLTSGLEAGLVMPGDPRGDVIVLLGGGVYDGVKDLTGIGAPSEDALARVVTAVRLQKRLHMPVIVSGGVVFPWRKAEAPVVSRFLRDLGVPPDRILLEDRSRDTLENARYVKQICGKRRFKRPILVTSAYHMRRALLMFRHFELEPTPVPVNLGAWDRRYGWQDYLPGDLNASAAACREYIGLFYYRIIFGLK